MFLKLFKLEIKKSLHCLPVFFAALAIFGVLIGTIYGALSRTLYEGEAIARATVGVVTDESDSKYIGMLIDYLSGMESAAFALDFETMDEEEAMDKLNHGKLVAVLLLPEETINGILYGENSPVQVVFSKEQSLSNVFLYELTHAGMKLLSSAQASTYAAAALYDRADRYADLYAAYDDIDMLNFSYVLSREKLFYTEDTLPAIYNYAATALILLLAFSHICFAPALRREDKGFYQLLFSDHTNTFTYLLTKYVLNSFLFFILLLSGMLIFSGFAGDFDMEFNALNIVMFFIASCLLTALGLFLEQLFAEAGAIMAQIILAIAMLFLCGAILPAAFLPAPLLNVGNALPFAPLHRSLAYFLSGSSNDPELLPMALWSAGLFAASWLILKLRKETY